MTIRQQYANEELVHKLRSMLNDLPTLRTRAVKKLKHWREAAIKRLLARQRELEKTLLDKFERLEFDTQLFVEKIERKKASQQRRWQSEPLDYHNKSEIDRISTNLRSIREELEQSKFILVGNAIENDMGELLFDDDLPAKLTPRYGGTLSTKPTTPKGYESSSTTNDLGSELKRVLDICTSPQRSSSSLSADEISPLQSLDHTEYVYDAKSKQTTATSSTTHQSKRGSQTPGTQRRNSRAITNVPVQKQQQQPPQQPQQQPQQQQQQQQQPQQQNGSTTNGNHKLFAFESFDDSIRRFQRLREIRKNLRTKYDDSSHQSVESSKLTDNSDNGESTRSPTHPSVSSQLTIKPSVVPNNTGQSKKNGETRHTLLSREPVSIPIERVGPAQPLTSDPDVLELYDRAAASVGVTNHPTTKNSPRDRRHRSKTLEANQIKAVDNQIYGCPSTAKLQQQTQPSHHRAESQQHRTNRLAVRRSSEDGREKQVQLRRHTDYGSGTIQTMLSETWLDIGQDHWVNLLEHGWRPTTDTSGVTPVSLDDSDHYTSRSRKPHVQISPSVIIDLYEQINRNEYATLFEQLDFAYAQTINLGNEFWRFLDINGNHQLCLYHQLNKQFIMYKPGVCLLSLSWPYDGIVDVSWSSSANLWVIATQTQIIVCNRSLSKIIQSIDIKGDWPKRITTCRSSIFHTYKIPPSSNMSTIHHRLSSSKDRPQFLLERYDYKLVSMGKHILESSTIWDLQADDLTEHLAILCDVALLIFDYQLNLLRQIEVTGFKVSTDHFGGWLIADYNASCIWQIRRNEYVKANKILHVERPWSVVLDQSTWTLVTLSETQNHAKRLLFFTMKNIPKALLTATTTTTTTTNLPSTAQSHLSISTSSSTSNSSL